MRPLLVTKTKLSEHENWRSIGLRKRYPLANKKKDLVIYPRLWQQKLVKTALMSESD